MARKCDNWLTSYRDWTVPRSEAPESYIFWTGIFALSSVMKRRVLLPKRYLGSWTAYPNFYIIFVSPPGKARKSTTVDYADDLLDEIPHISVASSAMTAQVLIKRLSETQDCSISIRSREFGTFIAPSQMLMVDVLTDLFDGKKKHSNETIMRNVEFVENPCVNLLGATTPSWISENLGESMVGGGFTSRVVFVYESKVRRRKLFYKDVDQNVLAKLKTNLVEDLAHLASNVEGEFEIENKETEDKIEEWYVKTADQEGDNRLVGYYERKPAHVLKLAMLLHLAQSDEKVITMTDFEMALQILAQVEKTLPNVFQTVGKNPYTSEMDAILEYIEFKGKVTRKELLARFYHAAPPTTLLELIGALVTMDKIRANGNMDDVTYSSSTKVIHVQRKVESQPGA